MVKGKLVGLAETLKKLEYCASLNPDEAAQYLNMHPLTSEEFESLKKVRPEECRKAGNIFSKQVSLKKFYVSPIAGPEVDKIVRSEGEQAFASERMMTTLKSLLRKGGPIEIQEVSRSYVYEPVWKLSGKSSKVYLRLNERRDVSIPDDVISLTHKGEVLSVQTTARRIWEKLKEGTRALGAEAYIRSTQIETTEIGMKTKESCVYLNGQTKQEKAPQDVEGYVLQTSSSEGYKEVDPAITLEHALEILSNKLEVKDIGTGVPIIDYREVVDAELLYLPYVEAKFSYGQKEKVVKVLIGKRKV